MARARPAAERGADLRARLAQAWAQLQCPYALERGAFACSPAVTSRARGCSGAGGARGSARSRAAASCCSVVGRARGRARGDPRPSRPPRRAQQLPAIELRAPKAGFELHAPVAFGYDADHEPARGGAAQPGAAVRRRAGTCESRRRASSVRTRARQQRLLLELQLAGAVDAVIYVIRGAARGRPRARLRRARLHAADPAALRGPRYPGSTTPRSWRPCSERCASTSLR